MKLTTKLLKEMIQQELYEMDDWMPPEDVPGELDPNKTYFDEEDTEQQQPLDLETVRAILDAGGYLTEPFDQKGVVLVGSDR